MGKPESRQESINNNKNPVCDQRNVNFNPQFYVTILPVYSQKLNILTIIYFGEHVYAAKGILQLLHIGVTTLVFQSPALQ